MKNISNSWNKRIGIVGGGQLGKMMLLEAKRLGMYVTVLDPAHDCPASSICDELIVAGFNDADAYARHAAKSDVITYEFEHINAEELSKLEEQGSVIYPSVKSLKAIQNKHSQKVILRGKSIGVPKFELVASCEQIREVGVRFGYPMMLKSTCGGYDGKGNALIKDENSIEAAFAALGGGKVELMLERFVNFSMEISVLATRGIGGDVVIYPIAENIHKNSILDMTIVPARIDNATEQRAKAIAADVMSAFKGVGTFCVEMFVCGSNANHGKILVNEVAPRPHNSGHYTIEGCYTNQFENHIRAIVGLPLGDVSLRQPTVMVNLLGESDGKAVLEGVEIAYANPNVKVHLYGKGESKVGRKMGHYTVIDSELHKAINAANALRDVVRVVGN